MDKINNAIRRLMNDKPAFRIMIYSIKWLIIIFAIINFLRNFVFTNKSFVPYSAKVVSYSTDRLKHAGVRYQNIELDNDDYILANGFTAQVNGRKTRLIDYIAVGDSVVQKYLDTICVYRERSVSYKFSYSPDDFK